MNALLGVGLAFNVIAPGQYVTFSDAYLSLSPGSQNRPPQRERKRSAA